MNLRINGQELRFRISKGELESLCKGEELEQISYLPNNHNLTTKITTEAASYGLFLIIKNNRFVLHVNHKTAKDFLESLPSREGLEATQEINDELSLKLFLEVDIRTQKRKRS